MTLLPGYREELSQQKLFAGLQRGAAVLGRELVDQDAHVAAGLQRAGDAPVGVARLYDVDSGPTARTNRGRLGGGEGSASESAQRGTGGDHDENSGDENEHRAPPVDRYLRAPAADGLRRRHQPKVAGRRGLRLKLRIGDGGHDSSPAIEPLFEANHERAFAVKTQNEQM